MDQTADEAETPPQRGGHTVRVRVTAAELAALTAFAKKHCKENLSGAIRTLTAAGLTGLTGLTGQAETAVPQRRRPRRSAVAPLTVEMALDDLGMLWLWLVSWDGTHHLLFRHEPAARHFAAEMPPREPASAAPTIRRVTVWVGPTPPRSS